MPTVVVLTPPTLSQEPVSLALLKAQARVDGNGEDALLTVYGRAAREKVEAYTGRYFAAQTLELTYTLREAYRLPPGATATAVTGFYTTLIQLTDNAAYLAEYQKSISVNRDLDWSQAIEQTYTVTATLTAPPVPGLALAAMLELAGEWYRNRETTVAGVAVISELPVSWRVKLAELVIKPIIH